MEVTLHIPDDVAKQISDAGDDVSQRVLEVKRVPVAVPSTGHLKFVDFRWGLGI